MSVSLGMFVSVAFVHCPLFQPEDSVVKALTGVAMDTHASMTDALLEGGTQTGR